MTYPVTALIACRDEHPEWIHRTLKSAYDAHAEEIIVVNDGSAHPIPYTVPRMRVYKQSHRGVAAALNHALASARQPYVARIDVGDTWHRNKLRVQYEALEASTHRACFCDYYTAFRGEDWIAGDEWREKLWVGNVFHGSMTMVEREACLPWDESLTYASDWDWHVRMEAAVKWLYVPQVLGQADEWPSGMSTTARYDGALKAEKDRCRDKVRAMAEVLRS